MREIKKKWRSDFIDLVRKHILDGQKSTSFHRVIDVNEKTVHRWQKTIPEFKKAIDDAKLDLQSRNSTPT